MRKILRVVWCFLFFLSLCAAAADASSEKKQAEGGGTAEAKKAPREVQLILKVPASSSAFSRFPVALVNDDPVIMQDLTEILAQSHEGKEAGKERAGKLEFDKILERIINTRLIIQEAMNIGLDDQPEYKSLLEINERQILSGLLMDEMVKDVKPDPAEVEKRFREKVVEWKIKSVLFDKEDDAKVMAAAVKAGKSFEELAAKAVSAKTATGGEQGEYLKPGKLLPAVATAGAALETGGVSQVLKVTPDKETKFLIFKLEDKRWPEDPKARQQAEQEALADKKNQVLEQYRASLFKQYVKIREKVLDGLDYESPKANLEKLTTDTRIVAEVKDGQPVTVGDLTEGLASHFYHGLEKAAEEKTVNRMKRDILIKLINRQLIRKEAVQRGIDRSDAYKDRLRDFKNSTLFGLFVKDVILPDIKMKQGDLIAYYEDHKGEYTYPEMLKLKGLAFADRRNAETALARLKKGDDINWVRANAEGLEDTSDDVMSYDGRVLMKKDLPEGMRKSLAKARTGDFILYQSPDGHFHVLAVQEAIPPRQMPFEDVQDQIKQKVFDDKVDRAIADWSAKLRAAADIKIYLSGTEN
jgi:parvulin-like peptidyl-prolyl isomerase